MQIWENKTLFERRNILSNLPNVRSMTYEWALLGMIILIKTKLGIL